MPRFYEERGEEEKEEKSESVIRHWKTFLVVSIRSYGLAMIPHQVVFLYYFVSCGVERIYQPMAYTFGLCGPLKLKPR